MPNADRSPDVAEALDALGRLLRYKIIDEQQAAAAARIITGDDSFVLPEPAEAEASTAAGVTSPPRPHEGPRESRGAQPAH